MAAIRSMVLRGEVYLICLMGAFYCFAQPARAELASTVSPANPIDFVYEQGQSAPRREVRDPCIIRDGDTYYLVFQLD